MPKVYRTMKCATDRFPVVESSNQGLGVRSDLQAGIVDVDLDADGFVVLNGHGMSVVPEWRKLPAFLIPSRLRDRCHKARGDNQTACFTMGAGPFQDGVFADQLELRKDKPHHGCIVPSASVPLSQFESNIIGTRSQWVIDEE